MRLWHTLLKYVNVSQQLLGAAPSRSNNAPTPSIDNPIVLLSEDWHIVGPFTVGTREALWGADPLEELGGFRALREGEKSQIRSSFAGNGTISWTTQRSRHRRDQSGALDVELKVGFSQIDWPFMQQVYGWAALQWQAWARGYIDIASESTQRIALALDHVLELWVDDEHYIQGDFYARHAAPLLLDLTPGRHRIDVRLIRDVRADGGVLNNPELLIRLHFSHTKPKLYVDQQSLLFAERLDIQNGPLVSPYASASLRNDGDFDLYVTGIETNGSCQAELLSQNSFRLLPGQTRPIAFALRCKFNPSHHAEADLIFHYSNYKHGPIQRTDLVRLAFQRPFPADQFHVNTYLHPNGIISHGLLRPPASSCDPDSSAPVFLVLHGAGVDVRDDMARHALDETADLCAWSLMPSGTTTWSGDDWHTWGWADVEAAIASIPRWISEVEWTGSGVDTSKWLVAGHSNGGQGVWYALTHHPDSVIAAAPISGYSSIQNYVPYTFWQPADPRRTAVVQAQLNSYRHELLLENAEGIPVLQQHGSEDDNVPTYHSRFMFDLARRAGVNNTYIEVPGQSHWWDGVMTTIALKQFYRVHLESPKIRNPASFRVVTATAADHTLRNGFSIVELLVPGQLGMLEVKIDHNTAFCSVITTNVLLFDVEELSLQGCETFNVDERRVERSNLSEGQSSRTFRRAPDGAWSETARDYCRQMIHRSGGLEAILRSKGAFQLVQHGSGLQNSALQIANSFFQYFGADVNIAASYDDAENETGNVISLAVGHYLPSRDSTFGCSDICQFDIRQSKLVVLKRNLTLHTIDIAQNQIAAAYFLRPLQHGRLELVLWAADHTYLPLAVRMLPLLTGSGFPDFVVATKHMLGRGLEGTFALGFLDTDWCPASTSYFARDAK